MNQRVCFFRLFRVDGIGWTEIRFFGVTLDESILPLPRFLDSDMTYWEPKSFPAARSDADRAGLQSQAYDSVLRINFMGFPLLKS